MTVKITKNYRVTHAIKNTQKSQKASARQPLKLTKQQ
jgi:hypothetical protein